MRIGHNEIPCVAVVSLGGYVSTSNECLKSIRIIIVAVRKLIGVIDLLAIC